MMKALSKFWSHHTALALGAGISLALLITFLLFQYNQSEVLKLESRWLLVSGVPLLAALLIGGYIKSFKGFGVELEASLNKPVVNMSLVATEAMDQMYGDEKRSINYAQVKGEKLVGWFLFKAKLIITSPMLWNSIYVNSKVLSTLR